MSKKLINQIAILPHSIVLDPNIVNDKRAGKTYNMRLQVASIYGLLTSKFNLSLNHIKSHYNKKLNMIYCISREKTLMAKTGLSQPNIVRDLKRLEYMGYIKRVANHVKHIVYIELPYIIKNQLIHPSILNFVKHTDKKAKPDKNMTKRAKAHADHKDMARWRVTTKSQIGLSDVIVKTISMYVNNVLKSSNPYEDATKTVREILNIKDNVNRNFKGIYKYNHHCYYYIDNNPYFQSSGFAELLQHTLHDNKNLREAISKPYYNFITEHSSLQLRGRRRPVINNNQHEKRDNPERTKELSKDLINAHNQDHDSEVKQLQTRLSNYRGLSLNQQFLVKGQWGYAKGTKEYKRNHTFKPADPALTRRNKKRLARLSKESDDVKRGIDNNSSHQEAQQSTSKAKSNHNDKLTPSDKKIMQTSQFKDLQTKIKKSDIKLDQKTPFAQKLSDDDLAKFDKRATKEALKEIKTDNSVKVTDDDKNNHVSDSTIKKADNFFNKYPTVQNQK